MHRFFLVAPLVLQTVIWVPTRLFFKFFFHYKIKGLEHLNNVKGGVIFAMNHTNELDVFLIPSGLPFWSRFMPIFYTSRETSFYKRSSWRQFFYGGFFFKLWGAHMVHVGLNDYEKALETHIKLLKMGKSINIFPEGRRTCDGLLHEGKPGIAYLMKAANVPVVPIGVCGIYEVSASEFWGRKRHVVVNFGKPLYFYDLFKGVHEVGHEDYKKATEHIMSNIKELIEIK